MTARRLALCGAALVVAACQQTGAGADGPQRAARALARRASSEALPERFSYGRNPTAGEITRVDIDAGPDGVGLPAGSGTAAQGAPLFAARCAGCHGAAGVGTAAAVALVGRKPGDAFDFNMSMAHERTKTVGNYWPYATTLYDYVHRAMPFDRPGSLTPDQVYSLAAYILARNGIIADSTTMNARTLAAVRMPARDHFVPDDRERNARVR